MNKHFIKNIEIKNFKCFENFKAEGFSRVNLIGGKNNVGKTAFMEAVFLISNLKEFYKKNKEINREYLYFELIKIFILIQQNRFGIDFLLSWILNTYSLRDFANIEIEIPKSTSMRSDEDFIGPNRFKKFNYWNDGYFSLSKHQENKYFYKIKDNNNTPNIDIFKFTTACNANEKNIRKLLSKIKKEDKNDLVNRYLRELFQVNKIDLTDDDIILFNNNNISYSYSEYGDGVKNFLNIFLTLLYNQNTTVFIDEIENGIHYTNLDKLWEIILTISKEQNVQVFATTHSKECIESFNRVQLKEKEENKDTYYFEMYRNIKQNNIEMRALDSSQLEYELTHQGRYRGE